MISGRNGHLEKITPTSEIKENDNNNDDNNDNYDNNDNNDNNATNIDNYNTNVRSIITPTFAAL